MIKTILLTVVILCAHFLFAQQQDKHPQNARDYFVELRDLNEFRHYTDKYVCFLDGNDEQGFAIMTTFADIRNAMSRNGEKEGLKITAKHEGLLVQTYFKGVKNDDEPLIYDRITDSEYQIDYDAPVHHGRSIYLINWKTGRYRLQVFALDYSKEAPALEVSGKCELIHPNDVPSVLVPR
jgi:hypothetical protein